MLSEMTPPRKNKYCLIPDEVPGLADFTETESRLEGGEMSYCLMVSEFPFCKMRTVLRMEGGNGCTTLTMYLNTNELVHLKRL
jgi:hypothetical protein